MTRDWTCMSLTTHLSLWELSGVNASLSVMTTLSQLLPALGAISAMHMQQIRADIVAGKHPGRAR